MSWNGTGTYSLPPAFTPEVNGTVIDAARYNGTTSDIATGITAALAKNGENVPTAHLPMGGFKHTGVADGNAAGQYIGFNQATAVGSLTVTTFTAGNINLTSSTVPANGMYLKAANNPALASNTTLRWDVNSAGAHTFAAPTAGTAVTVTGVSGALVAAFKQGAAQNAVISVAGNNATPGTSSFDIQQDGVSAADIVNRANTRMSFYTNTVERIQIAAAGNVTVNAPSSGDTLTVGQVAGSFSNRSSVSLNGSAVKWLIQNTSNTASSDASLVISVAGSSAGDAFQLFDAASATDWSIGLDNSDSDTFKIDAASTLTTTTNRFNVTTDGRWYGNALHNNAGAVTGTTNQYIASGTYTPTLTNTTNIDASTAYACQWIRVGNVVLVSGRVDIDPAVASAIDMGMSLPIASSLANIYELSGTGCSDRSQGGGTPEVSIEADTTNDRAKFEGLGSSTVNTGVVFQFTYVVL